MIHIHRQPPVSRRITARVEAHCGAKMYQARTANAVASLSLDPVLDAEPAWEKCDWYACRWMLEEYHKAQKTGCAIEEPQFTKVKSLEPTIALLSVVAVSLLNLRDLSRDKQFQDSPVTLAEIRFDVWSFDETNRVFDRKMNGQFLFLARRGYQFRRV